MDWCDVSCVVASGRCDAQDATVGKLLNEAEHAARERHELGGRLDDANRCKAVGTGGPSCKLFRVC